MAKDNCSKSDLIVQVKSHKRPRFKAGSELSGKVNRLMIESSEEITEDSEMIEVKITLSSEACSPDVYMN